MFQRKKIILFLLLLALVLALVVFQDFLQSRYQDSSFYLSESLVFSSYWVLFFPIFLILRTLFRKFPAGQWSTWLYRTAFVLLAVIIHLITFSFLVQVISAGFLDHTFEFNRNLSYSTASDLYKYVLVYWVLSFIPLRGKTQPPKELPTEHLWVTNGRKSEKILCTDILYIQAASPYVELVTSDKKFLHSASLKSVSPKLNPNQFVQIHKSTVVNLDKVTSLKSRLNGDYDVLIENGQILRLSRTYLAEFRKREQSPSA